ncbi:hypothetical protein L1987_18932 [Smallanthus sonchifolius]|uniref:Uncharacterized protein n=1 Tax=Smallanthus sonchifolius TaxID=185202 RepID=A0ACB9J1K6_9ASTR|nr:hypothetical protein L1987_18932 [Smallanthus sonchifolius]
MEAMAEKLDKTGNLNIFTLEEVFETLQNYEFESTPVVHPQVQPTPEEVSKTVVHPQVQPTPVVHTSCSRCIGCESKSQNVQDPHENMAPCSSYSDSMVFDDDFRVEIFISFIDPISIILTSSNPDVSEPLSSQPAESSSADSHAEVDVSSVSSAASELPDLNITNLNQNCHIWQISGP